MERWQKPDAENAQGVAVDHPSRSSLDYNTPLRSTRGNATATPSPFYKLSSELSRESLRIPGAVPFMWEQSPGRRKFMAASSPSAISPHSIIMQPQANSFVPESIHTTAADLAKPNLATLFRQSSLKGVVAGMPATADSWPTVPISSAIPQISPPPAADHPRSSSARYSVMQRNMPPGPSFNNAALNDNGDDDDTVSISDALTATACEGLSVNDSLMLSGALRPASTPSEARDFIMHRFLPAAHTIACESPQTPSRRFLPPVGVATAQASPATTARSNGSCRDHAAACAAASRPSPLRYVSASSTPASNAMQLQYTRGQLHAGSFHGEEEEEEEDDEEEEDPPFTPKACGIFPFHINLSFHSRHAPRARPSSKHQHNKQQQQKKSSKSMNCASTPMRILDILRDDRSSSHDDESPVHRLQSKRSEAERECTKFAVLERAGLMYTSSESDPHMIKPPFDSYYRGSPNLHQFLTAQQAASELYNEEASEYSSFQDAPSRFHESPSPAALHRNARASRAYNMQSPLVNSAAQRSRSFAGLQDDHPAAAIISTTEQHLLNSSFYYYNMHSSINKPHYQPQLASPSTYHTPLSSHVSASLAHHDNTTKGSYHDTSHIKPLEKANYHGITTNAERWDAHSPSSIHSAQKPHIINNALFEHEDQETNMIVNANCPSMFTTISEHVAKYSTRLNQGTALRHEGGHGLYGENNINGDQYVSRGDQCVSAQGDYNVSKGEHYVSKDHMNLGEYHHLSSGNNHMIDDGAWDHHVSNGSHQGDHYVSNNYHYASKDDPHYVINGDNRVSKGVQYVSNHGNNQASNGDLHGKMNDFSFLSKSLLSPPLPKSPTHSWLDRTMPLVASTNKSVGASSRFSHMHKAATPAYVAPVSMSKMRKQAPPSSAEAPKWEALVKGSHLQPGHLRFSKELYHQSQNVMKVSAS